MKTLLIRLALTSVLLLGLLAATPAAFAQEHGDEGGETGDGSSQIGGPDWDSVKEVTIWSIAGLGTFAIVMGVFYLFKRKVGGFPEHPSWVAPISIMPASELPSDDDAGHGDAHEAHAPAH